MRATVLRLAQAHQLSVYDAAHLELAKREGLSRLRLTVKCKRAGAEEAIGLVGAGPPAENDAMSAKPTWFARRCHHRRARGSSPWITHSMVEFRLGVGPRRARQIMTGCAFEHGGISLVAEPPQCETAKGPVYIWRSERTRVAEFFTDASSRRPLRSPLWPPPTTRRVLGTNQSSPPSRPESLCTAVSSRVLHGSSRNCLNSVNRGRRDH